MASETAIKTGIEMLVCRHSLWAIGLTDDPDRLEIEIGELMGWRLFDADTEQVAKNVEAHFVGKGMEGDSGDSVAEVKHVYIFLGLTAPLERARSIRQVND